MFKFLKEQRILNIYGVKLGGQPGQLPTVMIGSIFYYGHKIVSDFERGIFDKEKAEELLREEEDLSVRTGNPRIIDVNGNSPKSIIKFIDFVVEKTKSPFLLDATGTETKIAAIRHVAEVGLSDRTVYNSINSETKKEEIAAITEAGLKSAILLLFNRRRPTVDGRIELLKDNAENGGLLKISEHAGIEKPLIDTAVIDMPDPGPAAKTIQLVKEEYGLPCGCGPHNAINVWNQQKKLDPETKLIGSVVANVVPIVMGANFILYGPISKAKETYPACAIADSYVAYCMRQHFKVSPIGTEHPLFKIYK